LSQSITAASLEAEFTGAMEEFTEAMDIMAAVMDITAVMGIMAVTAWVSAQPSSVARPWARQYFHTVAG
jgi:hypothetical protein